MKTRRSLRNEILHVLSQGPIVSVFKFLQDSGCYDYSYGKVVFRQLEREHRITMTPRPDLHGHPLEVRPGPLFCKPEQIASQPALGDLWTHKTSPSSSAEPSA